MRKLILIVVALVIGVSAGLLSSAFRLRTRTLPYCTVANNAESYHMNFVRVKAKVHFRSDGMYIYENCDPVEALAASVQLEGSLIAPGDVTELLASGKNSTEKIADATIEGTFDAHASSGCWAPKFRIAAEKIELTSGISDYVPPASDSVKH